LIYIFKFEFRFQVFATQFLTVHSAVCMILSNSTVMYRPNDHMVQQNEFKYHFELYEQSSKKECLTALVILLVLSLNS